MWRRTVSVLLAAGFTATLLAQDREQTREELEAVTAAITEVEQWLDEANRRHSTEQERLREAELEISALQQSINALQADIESSNEELRSLRSRRQSLRQEKTAEETILADALVAAWKTGEHSTLKLLLNGGSPSESARLLHYAGVLTRYQLSRIESYQNTIAELSDVEVQLNTELEHLEQQQSQLQQQSQQLSSARDARAAALASLDDSISSRSQELEQLQIDQGELQTLLDEISRALEGIRSFDDVPPFAESRGRLPEPATGPLLSRFGTSYGGGSLTRQGIVIGVSEGSPVHAIHPGRVVFSDWLRGTGLLVIVDHGDGYMSLYGRNEALAASAGDWVETGQVLATSGRGGDGNSPGLYFEIRHRGNALNPADWLADLD